MLIQMNLLKISWANSINKLSISEVLKIVSSMINKMRKKKLSLLSLNRKQHRFLHSHLSFKLRKVKIDRCHHSLRNLNIKELYQSSNSQPPQPKNRHQPLALPWNAKSASCIRLLARAAPCPTCPQFAQKLMMQLLRKKKMRGHLRRRLEPRKRLKKRGEWWENGVWADSLAYSTKVKKALSVRQNQWKMLMQVSAKEPRL